jgi:glutamyl-tRNA synthetase
MSQFELNVATRASQAALLPAVLIATSINEARP